MVLFSGQNSDRRADRLEPNVHNESHEPMTGMMINNFIIEMPKLDYGDVLNDGGNND